MAIIRHNDISDHELRRKIKSREIYLGGNARLRIYGTLHCASGKRMKRENRVFFFLRTRSSSECLPPLRALHEERILTLESKYGKYTMNLFPTNEPLHLLPHDGEALYYGTILSPEAAESYYETLLHGIAWKNDEAVMFGKHIITKRKVAWYGDENYSYTYSNITKEALPWTKELWELKAIAENVTKTSFNSCLLNLYHDGSEGMAWHSDDEKTLGRNSAIASLSFGAERKFSFKHKRTKETVSLMLESGSLLVMQGATQTHWLHRLPPTTKVSTPRINLTFRTMIV